MHEWQHARLVVFQQMKRLCIWWQYRHAQETHRIRKLEWIRNCNDLEALAWFDMIWTLSMCTLTICISAAAFFRPTFGTTSSRRAVHIMGARNAMEKTTGSTRKDDEGGNGGDRSIKRESDSGVPRSQQEMREAAKSARAEAAKWELLAAAAERRGATSDPEETGRGRTRLRERREPRDTRSSSGETRMWKEKSTEDKKRRMGENRERMKKEVVRLHREKKEAARTAESEKDAREQAEREEARNEAKVDEANMAARQRLMKAKREAARKAVEKVNAEKKKEGGDSDEENQGGRGNENKRGEIGGHEKGGGHEEG